MHPLLRPPYAAAATLAQLAAHLAPASWESGSKWQRAIRGRRGLTGRYTAFSQLRDTARPLAWFHAPSVGEALMAHPVLDALPARVPGIQRALTWYSPSAVAFANRFEVDFRDYLPFDSAGGARLALDALRPSVLVFSKLDVWPTLTAAASRRGVPVAMIAATLDEGSGRRSRLARALLRDAYRALDAVGAASPEDADRLVSLGVRPDVIFVTGDTRFDQAWRRVQSVDRRSPPVSSLASDRPTVVAGSTWPSDEAPLLEAWLQVRQAVPDARLIVAPHEPASARVRHLRTAFESSGLGVALESAGGPVARADVVVVDRVGVLAELYTLGQVAVVGGGFHGFGLHSVIEPAAVGCPVIFGPEGARSRDGAGLTAAGGARCARGAAELAGYLLEWLSSPPSRRAAGRAGLEFVRTRLGAAERSVAMISGLLGQG